MRMFASVRAPKRGYKSVSPEIINSRGLFGLMKKYKKI